MGERKGDTRTRKPDRRHQKRSRTFRPDEIKSPIRQKYREWKRKIREEEDITTPARGAAREDENQRNIGLGYRKLENRRTGRPAWRA